MANNFTSQIASSLVSKLKTALIALASIGLTTTAIGQTTITQTFSPTSPVKYRDLTKKLIWGTNPDTLSGFQLVNKTDNNGVAHDAITMTDSAVKYASYLLPNGLKTSQAFDFETDGLIRTNGDSVVVEFDALWDVLSSGGENGRIVVALMHQIPDYDNMALNTVDSVNQLAPFGRPAYNWRVLNRLPRGANNYAHLFYGGGKDFLGEYEKFNNPTLGSWWLPGFISMPSGLSPGARPLYPAGPGNSWGPNTIASNTSWNHYRLVLKPELIEARYRDQNNVMITCNSMFIPRLDADTLVTIGRLNSYYGSSINKLPPYYNHFDTIRGVRFFFSGAERGYIANVNISFSGTPVSQQRASASQPLKLMISPNPVSRTALVRYEISRTDGQSVQLRIINSKGQVVFMQSDLASAGTINLSDLNLSSGLYLIEAKERTGKSSHQRLVIE